MLLSIEKHSRKIMYVSEKGTAATFTLEKNPKHLDAFMRMNITFLTVTLNFSGNSEQRQTQNCHPRHS